MRRHLAPFAVLAALALVLTVIIFGALAIFSGGKHGPAMTPVTVGGPHGTPTKTIEVPQAAVEKTAGQIDEKGLRTENLNAAQQAAQEKAAANDQLPIVTPAAAPQQRGCTTQLVQNYSTRRGVAPRVFVLHWTGSSTQGWAGVNAIVGLFDRPSFQASSNYVLDANGLCKYIVRESDKAWTQAAANPFAISVEVINPGSGLGPYLAPGGWSKLTTIVSDALDRWKIPLQRGRVVNCIPVVSGIVDHVSLGPCGGGHPDISTHYPHAIDELIGRIRAFRTHTAPKMRPALYSVVAWKKGPARKLVTNSPGYTVRQLAKQGYTRISVVRVKRK